MTRLQIQNFAHLENVDLEFGDLTVLVGAQGTGKSLALQWLKTALDGRHITKALADAGHLKAQAVLIDLIFGVGMDAAYRTTTVVKLNNRQVTPLNIGVHGTASERVFFIPAHRAMLISDGWCGYWRSSSAAISQKMPRRPSGVLQPESCPWERKMSAVDRAAVDLSVVDVVGDLVEVDVAFLAARSLRRRRDDARQPLVGGIRLEGELGLRVHNHPLPPLSSGVRAATRAGARADTCRGDGPMSSGVRRCRCLCRSCSRCSRRRLCAAASRGHCASPRRARALAGVPRASGGGGRAAEVRGARVRAVPRVRAARARAGALAVYTDSARPLLS